MKNGTTRDMSRRLAPLAVRLAIITVGVALIVLAFAADAVMGGAAGFGPLQFILLVAGLGVCAGSFIPVAILKNLLLLSVALLVAVGMVEGGLRLFLSVDLATTYQLHPRYLHELIPGSERRFRRIPLNGGQTIPVRVNSDGYRGAELLTDPPGKRIVVYGDSFIAAEFSTLENTFVQQLGTGLSLSLDTPVESVNAGVISYGPDQVSLRMEDELGVLNPDLVIVSIYADNDFGDLIRNKVFTPDANGGLTHHEFVSSSSLRREFWTAHQAPLIARLSLRMISALTVPMLEPEARIEEAIELSGLEYREAVVARQPEVTRLLNDHYDADLALTPRSESAKYKVTLMRAVLRRIAGLARDSNVPLALLVIPSPIDVIDGYDGGYVNPTTYPEYRRSTLSTTVADIATEEGVPVLNLFDPFRGRDPDTLYFHGGDDHWNDAGQAFAATLMVDFILANNLL